MVAQVLVVADEPAPAASPSRSPRDQANVRLQARGQLLKRHAELDQALSRRVVRQSIEYGRVGRCRRLGRRRGAPGPRSPAAPPSPGRPRGGGMRSLAGRRGHRPGSVAASGRRVRRVPRGARTGREIRARGAGCRDGPARAAPARWHSRSARASAPRSGGVPAASASAICPATRWASW